MSDQKDIKPDISTLMAKSILGSRANTSIVGSKLGTSTSRLPSFKAPRDLTLSAAAISTIKPQLSRPKKVYMPNIPIKREKSENLPESKSEKSQKKSPFKGRQQGRGKFFKKEKEFIQTRGSLFGEGIAASTIKRQNYSAGYKGGSGKDQSFMQKPVLNHDVAASVDKELEEKKLREILRDDFIDDPDEEDFDIKELYPTRLPMIATTKVFKQETQAKEKLKRTENFSQNSSDIRIKEEPVDGESSEDLQTKLNHIQLQDDCRITLPEETLDSSILSENSNGIMFFQLPSCLPGHPPEVKQEPVPHNSTQKKTASFNNMENDTSNPVPEQCTLATLPEGRIGTIKIYESGRTELWLDEHKLTINKGTQVGFVQDVICLTTNAEEKSGSLSVLGHIKHRLVCTPDFEYILRRNNL